MVLIIGLNAAFSFVQELQAERAVEELAKYLPQRARVERDGAVTEVDATQLVPGDIVLIQEGDRIAADIRLLNGAIEVDMSALTGESVPALRSAALVDANVPLLSAQELVFSGTQLHRRRSARCGVCDRDGHRDRPHRCAVRAGQARSQPAGAAGPPRGLADRCGLSDAGAVVHSAGHAGRAPDPDQLAGVCRGPASRDGARGLAAGDHAGVGGGGAAIGRSRRSGQAPLCGGDIGFHRRNLHRQNRHPDRKPDDPSRRMGAVKRIDLEDGSLAVLGSAAPSSVQALSRIAANCNNARLNAKADPAGDPTEIAILIAARTFGADTDHERREAQRRSQFHFDPERKLMSTVDQLPGASTVVHTKGAPEAVLSLCSQILDTDGHPVALDDPARRQVEAAVNAFAAEGLRVLAFACRELAADEPVPKLRGDAERDLCFTGLIALLDPPRAGVADAVAQCRTAGIRIIMITGDHPLTAAAIAQRVGITGDHPTVVTGDQFDQLTEQRLAALIQENPELIFARASPEAKLHIAEALRDAGHVVAMTGDGVNDAPALRCADIGVAMGKSGTDVAREAATMVLTDDNFSTIVTAVHAGRRIYDNVRKFIIYIFAHATPEVVPFLVFAARRRTDTAAAYHHADISFRRGQRNAAGAVAEP